MSMLVCFIKSVNLKRKIPANGYLVVGTFWPPFDQAAKAVAIEILTYNTSGALRELAPDMGSYLNEVCSCPAFWRFTCVLI
jgi:hypothetical protein